MIFRCPVDTCGRLIEAPADDPPTCAGAPMREHAPTPTAPVDPDTAIRADVGDPRAWDRAQSDDWDQVVSEAVDRITGGVAADATEAVAQLLEESLIDVTKADSLRIALRAHGHA